MTRIPTVLGAFVVLAAAVMRLTSLDLAPYQYDEADVLLRVFDLARGQIPLTGAMTSWGVPDPPMMVYLMAVAAWAPQPALTAAGIVAMLNVAAVGITYVAALRHFGAPTAVAAGLLFAVNPWAVYFGRRFWTEMLPVLTSLASLAALEVSERRDRRWVVPLGLALAVQIQARLLGGLYLPAALAAVLPFARRWLGTIVLTLALALVISAPFIVYVIQSHEQILRALREGERGMAATANTGLIDLVRWTISGAHILPLESRYLAELRTLVLPMRVVEWLTAGLLVAGVVLSLAIMAGRPTGWTRFGLLLLWAITPIALLATQTSSLYLHYLVVLSPFPFLLMALPVAWLWSGGRWSFWQPAHGPMGAARLATQRVARGTAMLLVGFVVVVQGALTPALHSVLQIYDVRAEDRTAPPAQPQAPTALLASNGPRETAQALGTGETYGIEIPMRFWLSVRDSALRHAASLGTDEVLVLTEGTRPLSEERPALVEGMLGPGLRGRYLTPLVLAIPLERDSLVLETWGLDTAESLARLGERLDVIPLPTSSRNTRDAVRLHRLPARSPDEWSRLAGGTVLDSPMGGLRLVGARAPEIVRPNETVPLVSYWLVAPRASPSADRVTARAVDERGQRGAQRELELPEGLGGSPSTLGVIMRHDLELGGRAAAGAYRIEVSIGTESALATTFTVSQRPPGGVP